MALEQQYAGELGSVHGEIASHWAAVGKPLQAAHHFLEAARAASRLYAHEEAIKQLQQALALLPPADSQRPEVKAELGEALMVLGRHHEAAAVFDQAATETEDPYNRSRFLNRRVLALSGAAQYEEVEAAYREALTILEAGPVSQWDEATWRIWLDLHLSLMDALYLSNKNDEMQRVCRVMAEPLEAHGTVSQRAEYTSFLARVRFRPFRFRLTDNEVELARSALEWARRTGEENRIQFHQFTLGFSHLWAGRIAEAINILQDAIARAELLGNVPLQNRCLCYLAIAYRLVGNAAEVGHYVEKLVPVAEAEGNNIYLGVAEALRAWLAWRAGERVAVATHGRAALLHWRPPWDAYPFQWLARFPLLALELAGAPAAANLADAQTHARTMLLPPQQRLPKAIEEGLETALAANSSSAVISNLNEVCRLARKQGYL